MFFENRTEAGRLLAEKLTGYINQSGLVVVGLPRGGVPVAYEVALALNAPLDVIVVRKLGVPAAEELAFGAIATGGVRVLNEDVVRSCGLSDKVIEAVTARELGELQRREHIYRGEKPPLDLRDRTVIVVDDGLATGATMLAAVTAAHAQQAVRIVVAIPTASVTACERLAPEVDEIVYLIRSKSFYAVGAWYVDFTPTTEKEVQRLLKPVTEQVGTTPTHPIQTA